MQIIEQCKTELYYRHSDHHNALRVRPLVNRLCDDIVSTTEVIFVNIEL
jgi:hypothetical protein